MVLTNAVIESFEAKVDGKDEIDGDYDMSEVVDSLVD